MDTYLIADLTMLPLLGEFSFSGLVETLYNITKVALGIGFVIFIHELGHFLAAKWCGVKCEKFYVGFDPPLKYLPSALFKFQWGETEYGIGIIPLGGYVKMLGQDDNPARAAEEAERSKIVTTAPDGEEHVAFDPRSYVAKSVPQRMLIISAGVIMNLISAVFLAAFAYRAGVLITPVEVAGSAPGDPAWVAGILPGDKIIQVGNRDKENENEFLQWRWDFYQAVAKAGLRGEVETLDFKIRNAQGEERWESVRPSDRQKELFKTVTVGVRALHSNELNKVIENHSYLAVGSADPPLAPNDRIVAINGEPLPQENANEEGLAPASAIEKALLDHVNEPLTLTIERRNKEANTTKRFDSVVPPSPWKSLGLVMEIGPIVGIRNNSPAVEAGFQVGDELVSVQGEPIGNPLTLPFRLPADDNLEFVVRRNGKEVTLSVTPDQEHWNDFYEGYGGRVPLETVGIAYIVTSTVKDVLPGSPAAESGKIQPGDKVTTFQLYAEDENHTEALKRFSEDYNEPRKLDEDVQTWPFISSLIQQAGPGVDFRVTVERKGAKEEVQLGSFDLPNVHYPDRGLMLSNMQRIHVAQSWGEAFKLGLRETGEKMTEVWGVLVMLFTGELPLNNLGGPVLIATVAGSEASVGIPRLLLFLTFLSANLAILNFLPIPVLDGGHMVFLMAEGVMGRPVSERIQQTLTFVGFCCLMALMVFVFANDLARLFGS